MILTSMKLARLEENHAPSIKLALLGMSGMWMVISRLSGFVSRVTDGNYPFDTTPSHLLTAQRYRYLSFGMCFESNCLLLATK